jgi:mannose-6-phosphate isomerase-like protein (cupin superfamily)
VVTGVVDGRSQIIEDAPVEGTPYWEDIWVLSPDEPLGHAPGDADTDLEPAPGAARWRVFLVPPDEVLRQVMAEHGASSDDGVTIDDGFFHLTNTVDLIYVLDGDVTLRMDDGEVLLHPGDCVVQRNTNHAWGNPSDQPVRLLGLMVGLP